MAWLTTSSFSLSWGNPRDAERAQWVRATGEVWIAGRRARESAAKPLDYAEGVKLASPWFPDEVGIPWVKIPPNEGTLRGFHKTHHSVPHVPLVIFDLVFLKQPPEFVLI